MSEFRRKLVAAKRLPYDSEIEYLESTGTQYINIPNVIPTDYDNTFETKITFLGYSTTYSWIPWFGEFSSSSQSNFYRVTRDSNLDNKIRIYNGTSTSTTASVAIGTTYNIKIYPTYAMFNNTRLDLLTTGGNSNTSYLRLFSNRGSKLRFYNFKYTKGDSVILDLIPVRVGTIGYMYDTISGQLFGNSGTGEFILGQDIVEVEYLKSDGTQYIDTLLYGDENTEVQIDFIPFDEGKAIGFSRGAGDEINRSIQIYISTAGGFQRFGTSGVGYKYTLGNRYNIILKNTKLIVNGEEYTFTASEPFTTPTTLYIFRTLYYLRAKVFSTKILKNNVVVFDGIPVRVGTTGYMYDKVSHRLYGNSGTGNFILGGDMKLPYDADIKYLECNGTQYINTLIVPNQNTRIECKYAFKEYNDTQIVFGCTDSADATDAKNGIVNLHLSAGTRRVGFGNGSGTVYASNTLSQPNTEYTIYFNKNEVYVNNTLITTLPTSSWSTTKKLFLFRRNGGTAYPLRGYIMYCKIWDDTTLVRDFTPVRVGQIGYMYDKVSRQLFGNNGTGSFVIPGTRFAKLILNNGAAVEISGSGALSQSMVSGYTTNCVGLVCGALCTSIEANTFENFTNLVSAELEDSNITTIKDYGFSGCNKLYRVTLPNTITSIGQRSFRYCRSLTTFNIPSSLKTIDYWAFDGCTSLESIVIPSTVTTVGAYAFQGCSNLTTLELYSMVTSGKNISEGMCISCTKLSSIVLPYGILRIGAHSSFKNCYALESVSIPNTVSAIGHESFRNCRSLPSVTIPSSVTSIGNLVFENCTSLTSVTCLATTPPTLGTNSFDGNASGRKIYVPSESVETYKTATNWSAYANDILPIPTE